ncbi:PREDICTED: uncharacterized protein LOC104720274 [Camelina sativa]|uniref:Uncharacterized protein LOC104720274 n=1 Tax=Camelina sativa TaxID=90675 RepID=A0ABM0U694_CAMSA|nr:PREDICTED: uncharacterized protein LOC104720274 [Camelina sativa]
MSKAYDRVKWDFLEAVMVKMGFDRKWISWIMWCVSSVSYQVLLNGQPRGLIKPQRGLRQGDPLSPYLFIICTEVLIANIKKAERESRITSIKLARDCPTVSHLLFADDSLFFCRAKTAECTTVMEIIRNYGEASGQEGSRTKIFSYVNDRLDDRVNGWSAKYLSKGGKEVMIKSVALALPTRPTYGNYKELRGSFGSRGESGEILYYEVTSKLTSAISRFWWKSNDKARGLHWVAWDKVMRGRYFRNKHPLHAKKPYSPSFAWRSIYSTQGLVKHGARWAIGSGYHVSEWHMPILEEFMDPTDIQIIQAMEISKVYKPDKLI